LLYNERDLLERKIDTLIVLRMLT